MKPKALLMSAASFAGAVALLHCIGDPPIPPLSVGPSDAAVDATNGDARVDSGADANADANACAPVTACTGGDGCCPASCTSKTDSDCAPAVCGDNIVEPGETCDDGNLVNGDACDPTCLFANTLERISGYPGGPGYADSDAGAGVRFAKQGGVATNGTVLFYADPNGTIRKLDPATGASGTIAGANGETAAGVDEAGTNARFSGPTALAYVDATAQNGEYMLFVLDGQSVRAINVRDPSYPVSTAGLPAGGQSITAGMTSAGAQIFSMVDSEVQTYTIISGGTMGGADLASAAQMNAIVYPASTPGAPCQEIAYAGYDSGTQTATFYVACPATIVQITSTPSGSTLKLLAGIAKQPGCADNPGGGPATLTLPVGLAVDPSGTLYFNDCGKIRKVGANGIVATYAGDGKAGWADATGGNLATAEFVSLGASTYIGGALYTVDGPRIRAVTSTGTSTVASGSGSRGSVVDPAGTTSSFTGIVGVAVDATDTKGTLYVLTGTDIEKVDPTTGGNTKVFTFPTEAGAVTPVSMTAMNGTLYGSFGSGSVWKVGVDGTGFAVLSATAAAQDLTNDGTNLYFTSSDGTIAQLTTTGTRSVVCGKAFANNIKDGSGSNAWFQQPIGIAYTGNGTLFVADFFVGFGDILLRKIDIAAGSVVTVAGSMGSNAGPQVDGTGSAAGFAAVNYLASDGVSLFAIDSGFGYKIPLVDGATIREINPTTYKVTTMIGTPGQYAGAPGIGKAAHLNHPSAFAYDPATKHMVLADESAIFRVR